MQESIQFVITEIRGMWRFRWSAMGVAWLVCIFGWMYVYTLPNVYEANAQVFVDADSRLVEVMGQVGVAPGVGATVFVVRQAMLARPQLEKVASEAGLDQRVSSDEEFDELILNLQSAISIDQGRYDDARNLYTISYADRDRLMAISVVETLLKTFVRDVLELNDQGSESATAYLDEQLTYYSNELSNAERALAAFKKKNIGLLPGDSGDIFERLQQEMNALEVLRQRLKTESDRRAALRTQLRKENPALPKGAMTGTTEMSGTPTENAIIELESQRSNLLLTYTEKHPDVIAIGEQLEQLYVKREAELRTLATNYDGIEGVANSTNPVYQTIQIALNGSGVLIAGIESEIAQYESRVRKLEGQINTIPDVEAEFAKLNRNYAQYQTLYNELLVQKERERMGEAGDERDVVSFNVIEPPSSSIDPVAPRRAVMMLLVMMVGAGLGAGLAYLRHINKPVFSSVSSLRKFSGRPVLGAISMTSTPAEKSRRFAGIATFYATGFLLVVAFVLSVLMMDAGVAAMQSLLASSS